MSKVEDWLHWTPRVLTILFAIFISIFAIDVFFEGYSFWETIVALFMHLIPTFILIILLLIAWKWEKVGGVLFIILGLIFTVFFKTYLHISIFFIISAPLFLIGFLFLISRLEFKVKKIRVKKTKSKKLRRKKKKKG